ncbi:MAG: hypothetical protein ACLGHO_13495 [Gammaproteobacteria bacterium]
MKPSSALNFLWVIAPLTAQAHPGHPAVMPQHAHVLFGIDPMYALVLTVVGAVGGVLVAARFRRVRSKIQ